MKPIDQYLYVWGSERSKSEYSSLGSEIEHLLSLDLAMVDEPSLSSALDRVGRGYVTRVMHSGPKTSFRARRAEQLWDRVDQLVAPPKKHVRPGRFNRRNEPVRYFASSPHTAIMELRPKPRDRFVIMVQKWNLPKMLGFAQFGLKRLPPLLGKYTKLASDNYLSGLSAEANVKSYLASRGTRQEWLRQDAFFDALGTELYSDDEAAERYRITSALGRQMLRMPQAKGMYYPTAQNNYCGANIAMAESIAKRALKPVEAWLLEMGDVIAAPGGTANRYYEGVVVRRGPINSKGRIEWGERGEWSPQALHLEIAPVPN